MKGIFRQVFLRGVPEDLHGPELGVDQLPVELVAVQTPVGGKLAAPVGHPGREVEGGRFFGSEILKLNYFSGTFKSGKEQWL